MRFLTLVIVMFFWGLNSLYSAGYFVIDKIEIHGNKKTKASVILREMAFEAGDTVAKADIDRLLKISKENLVRIKLFNEIDISYFSDDSLHLIVKVEVTELWYLWPYFGIVYADPNFSAWLWDADLSRLSVLVGLEKYNFRGRGEKLSFYLQYGFTDKILIDYSGLFIDKKRRHGFGMLFTVSSRNRLAYDVDSSYRIEYLYSLESSVYRKFQTSIKYFYRPHLHSKFSLSLSYFRYSVGDTVMELNPFYLDYSKNQIGFFSAKNEFLYDSRDNTTYPLSGKYMRVRFYKYGLHTGLDSIDHYKIDLKTVVFLPLYNRWSGAYYLSVALMSKNQPYVLNNRFGVEDYFGGYELEVIPGNWYVAAKTALRYTLVKPRYLNLKFIPLLQFNRVPVSLYCSSIVSLAYINDNSGGYLNNRIIYSSVISLDFVTYYDKIVSFQLTLNDMKNLGFYIHVESPF